MDDEDEFFTFFGFFDDETQPPPAEDLASAALSSSPDLLASSPHLQPLSQREKEPIPLEIKVIHHPSLQVSEDERETQRIEQIPLITSRFQQISPSPETKRETSCPPSLSLLTCEWKDCPERSTRRFSSFWMLFSHVMTMHVPRGRDSDRSTCLWKVGPQNTSCSANFSRRPFLLRCHLFHHVNQSTPTKTLWCPFGCSFFLEWTEPALIDQLLDLFLISHMQPFHGDISVDQFREQIMEQIMCLSTTIPSLSTGTDNTHLSRILGFSEQSHHDDGGQPLLCKSNSAGVNTARQSTRRGRSRGNTPPRLRFRRSPTAVKATSIQPSSLKAAFIHEDDHSCVVCRLPLVDQQVRCLCCTAAAHPPCLGTNFQRRTGGEFVCPSCLCCFSCQKSKRRASLRHCSSCNRLFCQCCYRQPTRRRAILPPLSIPPLQSPNGIHDPCKWHEPLRQV